MSQTIEEAKRIAQDWAHNFAPEDLVQNAKNAGMLVEYCVINFGVITAGNLNKAYASLHDQLDLIPPVPAVVPKTSEQLAAEEIARQHADYMKSIAPQESFDAKVARDKATKQKAADDKAQLDAKASLKMKIGSYQAYGLGRVDYLATEMVQKELSKLFITVTGKRDYVRTLEFVSRVINELPDHPRTAFDVQRVVESLNAQLA